MADQNNNNSPPNSYPTGRRASFAGQTFADLFSGGRNRPSDTNNSPPSTFSGPITSAAAQASRRRMSVSTLGISGSPSQSSPFGSLRGRTDSISSSNGASIDESAIEDEPGPAGQTNTPFGRRVSFGARALRDMNKSASTGGGGGGGPGANGRASSISTSTIPEVEGDAAGGGHKPSTSSTTTATPPRRGRGDSGFNWADNMRTRAERSSISAGSGGAAAFQNRAKSVSVMEQQHPIRQTPKPANVPDHFQERILKGDFYMD